MLNVCKIFEKLCPSSHFIQKYFDQKSGDFWQILAKCGYFCPKVQVAPNVAIFGNFGGDLDKNHLETLTKTKNKNTKSKNEIKFLVKGNEMPKCAIPGCSSNKKNGPMVQTFPFPKNQMLLDCWLRQLKFDRWKPTLTSRICCLHFSRVCYAELYFDYQF